MASALVRHGQTFDAFLLSSQRLPLEVLRRPIESTQYASRAFRKLLKADGIEGSMSRKGDCGGNAVVESFFGSLKSERLHWRSYQTREEAPQVRHLAL